MLRVQVPQIRDREEPYRSTLWGDLANTSEVLKTLIVEMDAGGRSPRDIEYSLEKALGQFVLSQSTVSELTDTLTQACEAFRPREHYTDTHGFTEQFFGLCYLLGYSFMPRLKDLPDQQLYKLDEAESSGEPAALLRQRVSTDLIREQWDQLVRVAAALRNRIAPAHVILERLAGSGPSDRLAKALTALGRTMKTIYILRYLHDPQIRQRVQLQLNRSEARHKLAQRLFFANPGGFRTGD